MAVEQTSTENATNPSPDADATDLSKQCKRHSLNGQWESGNNPEAVQKETKQEVELSAAPTRVKIDLMITS